MALLRSVLFLLLATFSSATFAGSFELSAEQAERVQKFLPHTYPKLV
jgi:hypothetical protein